LVTDDDDDDSGDSGDDAREEKWYKETEGVDDKKRYNRIKNRKYKRGWRRRRTRRKSGEMIRGRRINRTRKQEMMMKEMTKVNSPHFVLLWNHLCR